MSFANQTVSLRLPNGATDDQAHIDIDGNDGTIRVVAANGNMIVLDPANLGEDGYPLINLVDGTDVDPTVGIDSNLGVGPRMKASEHVSAYTGDLVRAAVTLSDSVRCGVAQSDNTFLARGGECMVSDDGVSIHFAPFGAASNRVLLDPNGVFIESGLTPDTFPNIYFNGTLNKFIGSGSDTVPVALGQKGVRTVSFTTQTAWTETISFPKAFGSGRTPVVYANINSSAAVTNNWHVNTYNISNTGFTIRFQRDTGSAAVSWTSIPVQWFALDTGA